ncbi:MAG: hypothetical protein LKF71_06215 [Oscillospiraceae bacterium]|jgi:predicted transcriptional regulator|nr:hypothetical protein [Oscillospiraceae bacterium]
MLPVKITIDENIRKLIRTKRKALGISGTTLSQLIDQKSSYISAVENGRIKKMSLEALKNIIEKLFDCDDIKAENIIKKNIIDSDTISTTNINLKESVDLDTSNNQFSQDNIKKYNTVETPTNTEALDDLIQNMKVGFETIQKVDAEFTVSTLKYLVTSMHFDLGFMMALFHIPYFALKGLDHDGRQQFLNDVSDIFKKYAILSKEHMDERKKNEDDKSKVNSSTSGTEDPQDFNTDSDDSDQS